MKFNELSISKSKKSHRVGRGIAAGQGKTAGRGTKGQRARTGSNLKPGFSGGQNPLMQKLPKLPGFRSRHAKKEVVYTDQLETLSTKVVTADVLAAGQLTSSPYAQVKLLHRGTLKRSLTVKLQTASSNAVLAVEEAGGSFDKVARTGRPVTKTPKKDS